MSDQASSIKEPLVGSPGNDHGDESEPKKESCFRSWCGCASGILAGSLLFGVSYWMKSYDCIWHENDCISLYWFLIFL